MKHLTTLKTNNPRTDFIQCLQHAFSYWMICLLLHLPIFECFKKILFCPLFLLTSFFSPLDLCYASRYHFSYCNTIRQFLKICSAVAFLTLSTHSLKMLGKNITVLCTYQTCFIYAHTFFLLRFKFDWCILLNRI